MVTFIYMRFKLLFASHSEIETNTAFINVLLKLVTLMFYHSQDVKFTIEGQMDYERPLFDGKVTAIFANNVVSFTGKLGDQSRAGRKAYVANMHLTNPAAYVDLQVGQSSCELL